MTREICGVRRAYGETGAAVQRTDLPMLRSCRRNNSKSRQSSVNVLQEEQQKHAVESRPTMMCGFVDQWLEVSAKGFDNEHEVMAAMKELL